MATISGTPQIIASGASYTPEAGSNRWVCLIALGTVTGAGGLTNIAFGTTKTPVVSTTGADTPGRISSGACVWKESELPVGATTVTPTWATAPSDSRILCFTIQDSNQSAIASSGADNVTHITPSITLATSVGDVIVGATVRRNGAGASNTFAPMAQDAQLDESNGGQFLGAHKTASSTSDTWEITINNSDEQAAVAVAFGSVSTGGPKLAAQHYRRRRIS